MPVSEPRSSSQPLSCLLVGAACLVLSLIVPPQRLAAQERASGADSAAAAAASDTATALVRVFVDCDWFCDDEYLRTELSWVAYVRDRADADVHVLVTRLGTGGGGEAYTVDFVGLRRFDGERSTSRFVARPGLAEDAVRGGLTRTIALGLIPYVRDNPVAAGLVVSYLPPDSAASATVTDDPWNAWVFQVGANGSVEDEQRQTELELDGELSARRITAAWKLGLSASTSLSSDHFQLDDRSVTNRRERYHTGAVVVRSVGPHWGLGAEAAVSSSTFDNMKLAVRVAPAVEYSIFPYSEATRRQLTLQYSLGVSSYDYHEETIFDRMGETRPTQALIAGYDVRQPWGSADATLEAANYLDDLSKHSLRFDGEVSLRLVRGLELDLEGSAALVRDQLALVKRDATEEEILLQRRELATSYRYSMRVGLSYTFGSIFSSVVNPRFGGGPGRVLR
ncbi:MAG: hypothetical protein ACYC2G_04560 [Gemmatimonadaceae bacterium]